MVHSQYSPSANSKARAYDFLRQLRICCHPTRAFSETLDIVSGGGAAPYPVDRTPVDLYQSPEFPNDHYVKFQLEGPTLRGTMLRLADPNAGKWEAKDKFELHAK